MMDGTRGAAIRLWVIGLVILVGGACAGREEGGIEAAEAGASTMDRLPDAPAGDAVRRAIEHAGGWQAWADTRSVDYRKTTIRYTAEGEVEWRRVQRHRYALHPGPKMRIDWEEDGRRIVLINNGQQAWKLVDGELADSQEDRDEADSATYGSHYVFCMPFKLTDQGAELFYEGQRELPDGTLADAVRAEYGPGVGRAGRMHHWTYFFAADDGRLVANHLQYGPEPDAHDFTEYVDHSRVGSLVLPVRRYGYQSNAEVERLERFSEIYYEDVRLDVELDPSLFELPPSTSDTAGG